jgi:hypothetical protein
MRAGRGSQKKRDREAAKMQWREEKLRRKEQRQAPVPDWNEARQRYGFIGGSDAER